MRRTSDVESKQLCLSLIFAEQVDGSTTTTHPTLANAGEGTCFTPRTGSGFVTSYISSAVVEARMNRTRPDAQHSRERPVVRRRSSDEGSDHEKEPGTRFQHSRNWKKWSPSRQGFDFLL